MNIMEEIFEIRSCIEILANDIKIGTADQYMHIVLNVQICFMISIFIKYIIHTNED